MLLEPGISPVLILVVFLFISTVLDYLTASRHVQLSRPSVRVFSLLTSEALLGRLIRSLRLLFLIDHNRHLLVVDFACLAHGLTLASHELAHLLLHDGHLQDLGDRGPVLGIFL